METRSRHCDALARLCRTCLGQPGLKCLVFEALLHAPLILLGEQPADAPAEAAHLVQILHPALGVRVFSNAVFSHPDHFDAFAAGLGGPFRPLRPEPGPALARMLADTGYPIVVDAGTGHAIALSHEEVRIWLDAVEAFAPEPEPLPPGPCELSPTQAPQLLRDRLAIHLSQLPGVAHAYLCRARPSDLALPWRQLLMVECSSPGTIDRLQRALPLLSLGLPSGVAPEGLLEVRRDLYLRGDAKAMLIPVYDRPAAC